MKTDVAIEKVVKEFTGKLVHLLDQQAEANLRDRVLGVLDRGGHQGVRGQVERSLLRKPASAKIIRSRKLQGQYLGGLKSLKGRERQQAKSLAKSDGVAAAVAFMKKLKGAEKKN